MHLKDVVVAYCAHAASTMESIARIGDRRRDLLAGAAYR
jgi:hypothetical protein